MALKACAFKPFHTALNPPDSFGCNQTSDRSLWFPQTPQDVLLPQHSQDLVPVFNTSKNTLKLPLSKRFGCSFCILIFKPDQCNLQMQS